MDEEKKKIIFVKWFPDDYITGCELLTWQSELVYSRIINRIYNTTNKLYDEDVTWNILVQKIEEYADVTKIKEELLRKEKIYIADSKIKNKKCDKYLKETEEFQENASERGRKGAESRWKKDKNASSNASSNAQAMGNHKPQTINHKPLNYKTIMEVWNRIVPTSHIQQMNDTRKNLFRSRFKSYFKESYEEWENFLSRISKISFLWGSNDREWKADFNWVLNENNLLKILEGKYEKDKEGVISSSDSSYQTRVKILRDDKITPFLLGFAQKNEADVREAVQKKDITKERAKELGIKID